jgi:hypothetical protein
MFLFVPIENRKHTGTRKLSEQRWLRELTLGGLSSGRAAERSDLTALPFGQARILIYRRDDDGAALSCPSTGAIGELLTNLVARPMRDRIGVVVIQFDRGTCAERTDREQ